MVGVIPNDIIPIFSNGVPVSVGVIAVNIPAEDSLVGFPIPLVQTDLTPRKTAVQFEIIIEKKESLI